MKPRAWGRRYTLPQKRAVMRRVEQGVASGLTWSEACRQADIGNATAVKFAAELEMSAKRRHYATRVKATPYVMRDGSFRTIESIVMILGHVANRAAEDVAFGLANQWLTDDLSILVTGGKRQFQRSTPTPEEASEAATWVQSAEGGTLCDLINLVMGKDHLNPPRLLRMARRKAAELVALGERSFGGASRGRNAKPITSALAA